MINSKAKGRKFEQNTARFFRRWFPDAKRQTYDQARNGAESPDVKGTPFWIECKHHKNISIGEIKRWLDKLIVEAGGEIALLRYKTHFNAPQYAMRKDQFTELLKQTRFKNHECLYYERGEYVYEISEAYLTKILDGIYLTRDIEQG